MLVDLFSTHGTYLNNERLPGGVPYRVLDYDIIRFGASTRHYKLKGTGLKRVQEELKKDPEAQPTENHKRKRPDGVDEEHFAKKPKEEKVRCRHVLVKHKDSRRPSSWKENKITRTKEDAVKMIEGYLAKLAKKEVEFTDLATTESDCSSHSRGGDLGGFTRAKMQKPFSDAAFKLRVGELSGPVHTESGVHLILRIS